MAIPPQTAQAAGAEAGPQGTAGRAAEQLAAEAALVHSPVRLFDGSDPRVRNSAMSRIPVEVDVSIPVRRFRVRNLLALATGNVIESHWVEGDDMPLGTRGAQLAWAEFEVIDQKLGVRITRLA